MTSITAAIKHTKQRRPKHEIKSKKLRSGRL
nr:MAG TPA: hypothetical protein [Herelleviridae sp.]